MHIDAPSPLAHASPINRGSFPAAARIGTIVYAVAVLVRHATYWSRAMLIGGRPNLAAGLALFEMATLVALLVLIVGRRPRVAGIVACAIVLLVVTAGNLAIDLTTGDVHASGANLLLVACRVAWLFATRAQFCAIPVMLLVASRTQATR